MSKPAVSDAQIRAALTVYAGMVHRVLTDPGRWLGLDEDPPPSARFPVRALDALRDRALGEVTPGGPKWSQQPVQKRIDWWVRRIGVSAGLAAAAPRFAGAIADRVPLQAALGASAAGLAVCATARELGVTEPSEWVPLLARVLLDRELAAEPADIPPAEQSEERLTPTEEDAEPSGRASALGRGAKYAAKTVWQLARTFFELQSLLDERPRGNLLARGVAKLPVVGLVGGWADERGGISRAARQTAQLLS